MNRTDIFKFTTYVFGILLIAHCGYTADKTQLLDKDENAVRAFLSAQTEPVKNRFDETVDLSKLDPKMALEYYPGIFQYGIPAALQEISKHTQNENVINVASKMAETFKNGTFYRPGQNDLTNVELKKNVHEAYQVLLNTFCWENGQTTEVNDFEVASIYIVRKILQELQALWK